MALPVCVLSLCVLFLAVLGLCCRGLSPALSGHASLQWVGFSLLLSLWMERGL